MQGLLFESQEEEEASLLASLGAPEGATGSAFCDGTSQSTVLP